MTQWAVKKDEKDGIHTYQKEMNAESLDGLPGLRTAMRSRGSNALVVETRFWASRHRRVLELFGALLLGAVAATLWLWQFGLLAST